MDHFEHYEYRINLSFRDIRLYFTQYYNGYGSVNFLIAFEENDNDDDCSLENAFGYNCKEFVNKIKTIRDSLNLNVEAREVFLSLWNIATYGTELSQDTYCIKSFIEKREWDLYDNTFENTLTKSATKY